MLSRSPLPLRYYEMYFHWIFFLGLALRRPPNSVKSFRALKASRQTLDRIKQLITQKTQSEIETLTMETMADDTFFPRKDAQMKEHHNELFVNNVDDYFQGDVDLSVRQAELLARELQDDTIQTDTFGIRRKRKVGREPLYLRWDRTKPISYEFADTIPETTRQKIRSAISIWEERTCIRFIENGPNVDRIEFFDGGGCSSFVGKTGGTQGISISTPGCDVVGIISHEIGHALGVFHEQARPDRNGHILINYNNIPLSRWSNFHAFSTSQAETYNLPYDAGSVMHYGAYGFATDFNVPTITTRDVFEQNTIGQREMPSFLDFEAINLAYRCMDHCPDLQCMHGGYTNPNDCEHCLCPNGFGGPRCEMVQYSECGALIKVSTIAVTISSPNYPENYPLREQCVWLLQAPLSGVVLLQFTNSFGMQCEDTCDKTYVEIKRSADFRTVGYRFCCSRVPRQSFKSVTHEMIVIFRSFGEEGIGFQAKVWTNSIGTTAISTTTTATTTAITTTTTAITTTSTSLRTEKTKGLYYTNTTNDARGGITIMTVPPTSITAMTLLKSTTTPASFRTSSKITSIPRNIEGSYKYTSTTPAVSIAARTVCECGEWSEWVGTCSQECGGCGKRFRERKCIPNENCWIEDKRACNFRVCPHGTNFLINNGEFHILWKGCCVGLFRSGDECSPLDDGQNPFLKVLESLLNVEDEKKSKILESRIMNKISRL